MWWSIAHNHHASQNLLRREIHYYVPPHNFSTTHRPNVILYSFPPISDTLDKNLDTRSGQSHSMLLQFAYAARSRMLTSMIYGGGRGHSLHNDAV